LKLRLIIKQEVLNRRVRSWELEVGGWKLEVGSWELRVGGRKHTIQDL
jgi:hypothetical protein